MTKYNIEGDIDFYAELYKSLDIEESEEKTDEDNNLCLITNQSLKENYFTMECGHKFNYIPLFLDIKNHKQKFNGMEGSSSRLSVDEIRCPYCRKKQKGLLPYYENLELNKIHGVNYIDPDIKQNNNYSYNSNYKTCEFITLNPDFDSSGNKASDFNSCNMGNCKYFKCFNLGSQINYYHGITEGENYGDEKYYCWSHKKQTIKKYKQEIKNKAKEESKKAKTNAKEEAKKAKDEEKLKVKEEKLKAKEELKNNKKQKIVCENVVLGPTVITDMSGNEIIVGCIEILKSGLNKGKACGCKIISENMCKRHLQLKIKN
jgi:hypothetical protein